MPAAAMTLGVALVAGAGSDAAAQDGPSFDCARPAGPAETLICADAALAALDRRLDARFAAALAAAQGLDAGSVEAVTGLRAPQRRRS